MKPYRIVPLNDWLFLSNKLWPQRDLPTLRALGIGAVVNLCEHHHYDAPTGVRLLEAGFPDGTGVPTSKLGAIYDFIAQHSQDTRILIHCSAGVSRSAGIAVGQLLLDHPNWSWDQALAIVHMRRSVWVAVEVRASIRGFLASRKRPCLDTEISPEDADALAAIERACGVGLPPLAEVGWKDRGYVAEEGRVTGIGLSGACLSRWPAELGRLRHLRVLVMSENEITELPAAIADLSTLERLDLSGNRLAKLPAEFASLRLLRHLNLSRNALHRLPAGLGALSRLEELCLHRNRLERLPEEVAGLVALQELYLQDNALRGLPSSLGSLLELKRLSVSGNVISELPKALGHATSLVALGLGKNRLRCLPETLGLLQALDNLNLSSNLLTMLPASLVDLRRLRRINLGLNPLGSLPPDLERWLAELEAADADVIRKGWIDDGQDTTSA